MLIRIYQALQAVENSPKNQLFSKVSMCTADTLTPIPSDTIYEESVRLIMEAQKEVLIQFYRMYPDSNFKKMIIDAIKQLQQKAVANRQPITVKILLNKRGKWAELVYKKNHPSDFLDLIKLNNEFFSFDIAYNIAEKFDTFHTKMIVIDEDRTIIPSVDGHPAKAEQSFWHENATVVTGQASRKFRDDFVVSWNQIYQGEDKEKLALTTPKTIANESKTSVTQCLFISKKENGNPLRYKDSLSPYKVALLEAIKSATTIIKIMTPNINDPDICNALAEACNRGIKVQILLSKHHNDDNETKLGGTNFSGMNSLVSQVDDNNLQNLNVRWGTTPQGTPSVQGEYSIHARCACIDDVIMFLGSTPLDKQGLKYSREADLIIEDAQQSKVLLKTFFNEKFKTGKDYFIDCCDEIIAKMGMQIDILTESKDPFALKKANVLEKILGDVKSIMEDTIASNPEKPKIILAKIIQYTDVLGDALTDHFIQIAQKFKIRLTGIEKYIDRLNPTIQKCLDRLKVPPLKMIELLNRSNNASFLKTLMPFAAPIAGANQSLEAPPRPEILLSYQKTG